MASRQAWRSVEARNSYRGKSTHRRVLAICDEMTAELKASLPELMPSWAGMAWLFCDASPERVRRAEEVMGQAWMVRARRVASALTLYVSAKMEREMLARWR